MKTYIYADKFFLKSAVHGAGYLEIIDGKFGDIVNEVPEDAEVTDYSGQWIAPGLVDTHIHGFMNHDVMDNDAEGIKAMSEGLLSCGVTSFLSDDIDFQQRTSKRCSRNYRTSERFCYRCENPRDLF